MSDHTLSVTELGDVLHMLVTRLDLTADLTETCPLLDIDAHRVITGRLREMADEVDLMDGYLRVSTRDLEKE